MTVDHTPTPAAVEAAARAYDPLGWAWYDRTVDATAPPHDPTRQACAIFRDTALHNATAALRAAAPLMAPGYHRASVIQNILRDVAEIERDPLPEQSADEMRVTADELHLILDAFLPPEPTP